MINNLIEKIKEKEAQYKVKLNKGVSIKEKETFLAEIGKCFDFSLPKDYLDFLDLVNGLGTSDISIYGIDEELLDENPNQSVAGFIYNNKYWSEFGGEDLIFLGDSSLDFFVYRISTAKYYILDRSDLEEFGEFESFKDMFEYVVGKTLE